MKVWFWTKGESRFWTNLGSKTKGHLLLTLLVKETFYSPCLALNRHLKAKLVQNLIFKMATIGPEPNLTAHTSIHIHTYTYIYIYIFACCRVCMWARGRSRAFAGNPLVGPKMANSIKELVKRRTLRQPGQAFRLILGFSGQSPGQVLKRPLSFRI